MKTVLILFTLLLCDLMTSIQLCGDEISDAAAEKLSPELRHRCLKTLRDALSSAEFWPAMHAAEGLSLTGHGPDAIPLLKKRLAGETNDQRRCGLARELVRAGDRNFLPILFEILGNEASDGRVHAAESLFKLGELGDGVLLQAAFDQKNNLQLRLMAAAALARIKRPVTVEFLRQQLQAEMLPARNSAAFALARVGSKQDLEALQEQLELESDPVGQAMLTIALASLGDPDGCAALKPFLDSDQIAARSLTAECAGKVGCLQLQARLIEMVEQDPALDPRVRAAQSLLLLSASRD